MSARREPRRECANECSPPFTTVLIPPSKMLPRNARRVVLTAAMPLSVRVAMLSSSRSVTRASLRRPLALTSAPTSAGAARVTLHQHLPSAHSAFHSSARRQNEMPKSPFATFVEVLREELRKNRELQDNVKQLQGDVEKLQDSEAMKRAREAYERARVCLPSLSL